MSDPVERLRNEVETIARSESPSLTFAALSPEGLPHAATVWFAPTEELDLLTFSAPTRIHAQYIDACNAAGVPARVAGGLREENQRKSDSNCHGLTFEGVAKRLRGPWEVTAALAKFMLYGTFQLAEINKYINHPTPEVPPHGVYLLRPTRWTVFDGRLGSDNPDRLVHLDWRLTEHKLFPRF